jgi:hypothetical protein
MIHVVSFFEKPKMKILIVVNWATNWYHPSVASIEISLTNLVQPF